MIVPIKLRHCTADEKRMFSNLPAGHEDGGQGSNNNGV